MERQKHLHIMLSDTEEELIKKRAKDEEMSIADYIRYAVLLESFYVGEKKAYKMLAGGFTKRFMEWFHRRTEGLQQLEND